MVRGRHTAPVTTGQIYWGAVPFVVIQVVMVGILIAFPGLVTGSLTPSTVDPSKIEIRIETPEYDTYDRGEGTEPEGDKGAAEGEAEADRSGRAPAPEDTAGEELEKAFKRPR